MNDHLIVSCFYVHQKSKMATTTRQF